MPASKGLEHISQMNLVEMLDIVVPNGLEASSDTGSAEVYRCENFSDHTEQHPLQIRYKQKNGVDRYLQINFNPQRGSNFDVQYDLLTGASTLLSTQDLTDVDLLRHEHLDNDTLSSVMGQYAPQSETASFSQSSEQLYTLMVLSGLTTFPDGADTSLLTPFMHWLYLYVGAPLAPYYDGRHHGLMGAAANQKMVDFLKQTIQDPHYHIGQAEEHALVALAFKQDKIPNAGERALVENSWETNEKFRAALVEAVDLAYTEDWCPRYALNLVKQDGAVVNVKGDAKYDQIEERVKAIEKEVGRLVLDAQAHILGSVDKYHVRVDEKFYQDLSDLRSFWKELEELNKRYPVTITLPALDLARWNYEPIGVFLMESLEPQTDVYDVGSGNPYRWFPVDVPQRGTDPAEYIEWWKDPQTGEILKDRWGEAMNLGLENIPLKLNPENYFEYLLHLSSPDGALKDAVSYHFYREYFRARASGHPYAWAPDKYSFVETRSPNGGSKCPQESKIISEAVELAVRYHDAEMLGNVMKAFPEDGFWIFSQFVMYYCKDHLDGAQVKDLLPPREFWQQATGVPLSSEQLESHFYFPSESSVEEHRRRLTKDYLSDSCYFGMLGSVLGKGYADPSGTMWIVLIESLCQIDTEHAMLILELTYASYREDKVEFSAILREINDRYYRDMGFIVCCEWIQDKQGRWFPMVFPLKIVETKQRGLSLDWSSEQEVTVYHVKMFTDRTEGGPTSVGEYLDGLEYLGYLQEGFSVASHAHSEQYWQRVEAYPETTTGPIIVVDNENNSAFSWRATIQRAHASTDTNNLFLGLIRKMYDGRVPTQQQVYQDLIWDTENHELRHLQDAHERIGANEYLSTYTELAESQEPWLTFCNNIVGVVKYNGQRMQLALYRDSQGQLVPSGSGENHGQAQMSFLNEVAWRHGVLPEGQDFSDLGVKNPVLFDQKIREVFSILQNNYDADDLRDLAKDLLEETIPE